MESTTMIRLIKSTIVFWFSFMELPLCNYVNRKEAYGQKTFLTVGDLLIRLWFMLYH